MRAIIALSLLIVFGCVAPQTVANRTDFTTHNYDGGGEQTATVGSPFVTSQRTVRGRANTGQWIGLLNSPDGFLWVDAEVIQRHELIYSGRDGNTLLVAYREYEIENVGNRVGSRDLYARPAYSQDLRYDLDASDMIVFRSYRVQVLDATNEMIRVRVLADENGSTVPPSTAPLSDRERSEREEIERERRPSGAPSAESEYERGVREERERRNREQREQR